VARATVPPYRRYYEGGAQPRAPASSSQPAIRERAIELAGRDPLENPSAFIHRDYHHGNTLWVRGRLTAVVDWTTASFGSPPADVAHMRANLAMSFGLPAADLFLAAWRQVEPTSRWDPVWDVRVAVDFIPDLPRMLLSVRRARRLEGFVTQAITELGESITGARESSRGQCTRRVK
jgi:Ser/Thr protein kinase RdoA (MazF antagonist)